MKKFRKVLSLLLAAVMVLSMAAAMAGCKDDDEMGGETTVGGASGETVTYTVSVKSAGGLKLSGVDVYIYDSSLSNLEQYGETNDSGVVTFELPQRSDYAIVVSGAPKGYAVEEHYSFSGTSAEITLMSSLIADENLSSVTLGLGDVMYDFSVTTPGGETVTLSEMLEQKDMVLINFWYTTCTWCVKEFPYMQQSYELYSDNVGIIAVNPFEEDEAIRSFQEQYGLTFSMAKCPASWSSVFSISGYPTSIVVDRYGVICLIESGGITSTRPFISMFEHFSAEDYQTVLYNEIGEMVTSVKPTYEMPSSEEIAAVVSKDGINATYRPETEGESAEYSWPFIITEKDGISCIKASNQEIESSYAILYADVEMKAGQALAIDYLISSEKSCDILYVIVDDEPIYSISGVSDPEEWTTCYPWVAEEDGTYEVALCYLKDEDTNEGDDTVYIKGLRIVGTDEIDTATYLPRYAATSKDGFEYEYVNIVLSQKDGYYHVGTADGPLLLADLMNYTQFNEEKTVYELAYDGVITLDGYNYYEDIVDYCSYASNSSLSGFCTVNEELAEYLKIVAQIAGFKDDENEWLKICKYYEAYGTDEQLQDPIKGLATFSAYKATLGTNVATNTFYYDRPIIPRGLIAEFTPTKSGVYRITSRSDTQYGLEAWIFDENHEQLLVYEMNERMYNDDMNVSMLYYMEAGKSYYIDIAGWDMYEVLTVYYDIEYVAPTYDVFRLCSPGYFTYDTNATGDAMYSLIAGGVDVILGEDGIYYEDLGLDKNGNQKYGSKIYCDFTGITALFSNPIATVNSYDENGNKLYDSNGNPIMISGMIDMGGFDFSKSEDDLYVISFLKKFDYDVEATDAYLREQWGEDYDAYAQEYQLEDVYAGRYHGEGEDLTEEIRTYLDDIITTGSEERRGCVVVTERLGEILQMLMDKYTFKNVDHSWTKMCYYYDHLGPQN